MPTRRPLAADGPSARRILLRALALTLALGSAEAVAARPAVAQGRNDEAYGEKIREYTTDERFLTELVDHLPLSETVPSPLEHFGTIIGAPDILHTTAEIYGYMRALAAASPRIEVHSIGRTEENREMIEVVIADEETLANLESYRSALNQLADPRSLSDDEARQVIGGAKPIYYITAGLHSPETGPPEMVMELAYRLAVEETPFIRSIRENAITIIVPVTEPDGRDRMVDTYRYRKANDGVGPSLRYWGKYVAHDNNRDGNGFGLALTRNILNAYLHWKPTVMHDLHESGYFLYTSTGSGPYNEQLDALTIDEWHNLAHEEVTELTKRGMPGVWTHAFYTGWAANYLMWIANTRNSIGRFYETLGNGGADTRERELPARATSRQWYRPNPPLKKVVWSLRNNTNYMQSGVIVALKYVADHGDEFLENFYLRGQRAVERGGSEAPYAWVIPHDQRRMNAAADLANLLHMQGIEVHIAEEDLSWGDGAIDASGGGEAGANDEDGVRNEVGARAAGGARGDTGVDSEDGGAGANGGSAARGAYVIRLDQPYRNLVQILLAKQNFPTDANPPYDDTGWTLPYLHDVEAFAVADPAILEAPMRRLEEPVVLGGALVGAGSPYYLVDNSTDDEITVLRFRLADIAMEAAEAPFDVEGQSYAAGSFVIRAAGNAADLSQRLEEAAAELGVMIRGVGSRPDVATHDLDVPRVALVHTWVSTPQDAGWWRLVFDRLGIPYTYLSEQDLRTDDLSGYDVVIMPGSRASSRALVQGTTEAGPPIPWQSSPEYPALGHIDQTDDLRRGMGYEGLIHLRDFLRRGGVFVTAGATAAFPIDMGLTRRVSIQTPPQLTARGTVLKTVVDDDASPIAYGYPESFASYFNQRPVFEVDDELGSNAVPEWLKDETWTKEVPRVVVRFAEKDVLMSGMLRGESGIAGTPAVVDVPVGDGHVVLFATNPFWRLETSGSHALVFNTMLHWNDLRAGWPERPSEEEETVAQAASGS